MVVDVIQVICDLVVCGVLVIGIVVVWGVVFVVQQGELLDVVLVMLCVVWLMVVNLMWVLDCMKQCIVVGVDVVVLVVEVWVIQDEDFVVNWYMGEFGVLLIVLGLGVLIYCNIGLLVIVGFGMVLGVICVGVVSGCIGQVYVGEMWLWQQGV